MEIRLGNLTPRQLADRVGLTFTKPEMDALNNARSGKARLTGPEDFHIFEHPAISITIGSTKSVALAILLAANIRKPATQQISVSLDEEWKYGNVK